MLGSTVFVGFLIEAEEQSEAPGLPGLLCSRPHPLLHPPQTGGWCLQLRGSAFGCSAAARRSHRFPGFAAPSGPRIPPEALRGVKDEDSDSQSV